MTRSRRIVARAPGKLMLAGEYSVLAEGGLALAVCLPEGVEVSVEPAAAWRLCRADGAARPSWTDRAGRKGGEPVPAALSFVHEALAASRAAYPALGPHALTTRQLGDLAGSDLASPETKPGVGGSASATVATVAALAVAAGEDIGSPSTRDDVLLRALGAHRAAQGGRGSGYDVATIVYGGLVEVAPRLVGLPVVRRIGWPAEVSLLAGYSGQSASTRSFLARVVALETNDAEALRRDLAALASPVRGLRDALIAGDLAALGLAVGACHGALAAWDAAHDLGIVTPAITALLRCARQLDVAAKIAGAGGGDSVVAFCADPERLAALSEAWAAAGFSPFDVRVTPNGVHARAETALG